MCRLFGFRSVFTSQVHKSLVSAENALVQQSEKHPDGWGVAYFIAQAPHIIKSSASAFEDSLFQQVSGIVASETVLAHLRKATLGSLSTINTHPFQFGSWVFAHNGNIKNFSAVRDQLFEKIDSDLSRYVLGDTDSELIFFMLLTQMRKRFDIHSRDVDNQLLVDAISECVAEIVSITGPFCENDDGQNSETFLSFIITNGQSMASHQGGKKLFYSTYKKRCSERETCKYFADYCEAATTDGKVNHLLFSSEPLGGENIWIEMPVGQIISISPDMKVLFQQSDN